MFNSCSTAHKALVLLSRKTENLSLTTCLLSSYHIVLVVAVIITVIPAVCVLVIARGGKHNTLVTIAQHT